MSLVDSCAKSRDVHVRLFANADTGSGVSIHPLVLQAHGLFVEKWIVFFE